MGWRSYWEIRALARGFSEEWGGGKGVGDGCFGGGNFTGLVGSGTGAEWIFAEGWALHVTVAARSRFTGLALQVPAASVKDERRR